MKGRIVTTALQEHLEDMGEHYGSIFLVEIIEKVFTPEAMDGPRLSDSHVSAKRFAP